ncbi:MAG: hypothetical protein [Bacteriophage sp.]|nr:MAG: hypothetical protein [Bacteriophage sp.]
MPKKKRKKSQILKVSKNEINKDSTVDLKA